MRRMKIFGHYWLTWKPNVLMRLHPLKLARAKNRRMFIWNEASLNELSEGLSLQLKVCCVVMVITVLRPSHGALDNE